MDVPPGIRMQMVMPMLRGPPQHAFLSRALCEECEHELECPAGRVGTVREIAMIPAGYRKHAQPIQGDTNGNRFPRDARPGRCDAACMDSQKRDEIRIHDLVVVSIDICGQARNLGCFRWATHRTL